MNGNGNGELSEEHTPETGLAGLDAGLVAGAPVEQFLAIIAHELRQPLGPILAAAALLRRDRDGDHAERALQVIERQVRHLERLVDDLLDATRLGQHRMGLSLETVDIRAVVAHAVDSIQPVLEHRDQRLWFTQPDQPAWMSGDPDRLNQIFSNLLQNAVSYNPRGGSVWVDVTSDPERISIRVEDTGSGIPAAVLKENQLFTLFSQGKKSTNAGLGVGLHVVKGLVELHGGTVEAQSLGRDHGSVFVVTFPPAANTP